MSEKVPRFYTYVKPKINFCIQCFDGWLFLTKERGKSFFVTCNSKKCNFKFTLLKGAQFAEIVENERCVECDSAKVFARY